MQALPAGYTPIAQIGQGGVSAAEGLEAAARQAEPKAQSSRSAEPIGPVADFVDMTPVPVPSDDPIGQPVVEAETAKPIPPNVPPLATDAQKKKLNVLVGKLRDAGAIETEHLWSALAKSRSFEREQMIELLEGKDADGVVHWAPLRDSLTRPEATELIDRLVALEEKKAA